MGGEIEGLKLEIWVGGMGNGEWGEIGIIFVYENLKRKWKWKIRMKMKIDSGNVSCETLGDGNENENWK